MARYTMLPLNPGDDDYEDALRCLNSHDDLLAACESMLYRFGHLDVDPGKREACDEARAAIAKAKPTRKP